MKQRINLYQERFHPQLDLMSLSSLSLLLILLMSVIAVSWVSFSYIEGNLRSELVAAKNTNLTLQQQVDGLQAALAARKPDEALQLQVSALSASLGQQERMLTELASRELQKNQGFSLLLDDLAAHSSTSLWLSQIEVSESLMRFNGKVSEPKAVPQWLQSLADSRSFSGKSFDTARVYREKQELRFSLATERANDDAPAKRGRR